MNQALNTRNILRGCLSKGWVSRRMNTGRLIEG